MTCKACNEPLDGDEILVPKFPTGVFRYHGSRHLCRAKAVRAAAHSFPGCSGKRGSRVSR